MTPRHDSWHHGKERPTGALLSSPERGIPLAVSAGFGWLDPARHVVRLKAVLPNPENSASLSSACFLYVSLSLFPGTPLGSVVKVEPSPPYAHVSSISRAFPTRTATSAHQLCGLRGSHRGFPCSVAPAAPGAWITPTPGWPSRSRGIQVRRSLPSLLFRRFTLSCGRSPSIQPGNEVQPTHVLVNTPT